MASHNFNYELESGRYSKGELIGRGHFKTVYKAEDKTKNIDVALKIFKVSGHYKYAYRELCALKHVKSRYLLELFDAGLVVKDKTIEEIWLALTLMDYDLGNVLYTQDLNFSLEANIKIMYQILKGLQYLFEAGIIHRNLKPANIGVNRTFDIRILGFGSSRENDDDKTKTVQTIYYRAIEIFLNTTYSTAIDMWSAGCVFTELFTKKILFKGPRTFHQLRQIVEITGVPTMEDAYLLEFKPFAAKSNQLRNHIEKDIRTFVSSTDQTADNVLNLICSMIELDPKKRLTPDVAINCKLFKQYSMMVENYPNDPKAKPFSCECTYDSDDVIQGKIMAEIKSMQNNQNQ